MPTADKLRARLEAGGNLQAQPEGDLAWGEIVNEAAEAMANLDTTGDEEPIDFLFWRGPAWGDDDLIFDVWGLTSSFLINSWRRADGSKATNVTFLDKVSNVAIYNVADDRSPYVAYLEVQGGEGGRLYAKDEQELSAFCRSLITQRLKQGGNV